MSTRSLAHLIPTDEQAEPDNTSHRTTEAPTKKSASTKSTGKAAGKKSPSATRKTPAKQSNDTTETSTSPDQRGGRPRIPKPGPVTRVTVDLAVTEQTHLEKLTAQIGREIDRGRGKNKIYPQHLMRVAIRRLLTDDTFRAAVTADLAEGRDELKREHK